MLRLSATLLDSYRLFKGGDGGFEIITVEDMIARVRKEPVEETQPMRMGNAFHAVAQEPDQYCEVYNDAPVYVWNEVAFDAEAIDKVVEDINERPGLVEFKTEDLVIDTDYGPVRIVCQADVLSGRDVFEYKTSLKPITPQKLERYMESMQWRAYSLAFNASAVHYRIVELKLLKDVDIWTVDKVHCLPLYPYPSMATDIAQVANELSRWIHHMGLEEYRLEEKRAA